MSTEPVPPTPEPGDDRLLDHEYDGIREYDNPLPRWWTLILWATVIYSALYALNLPGIGIGRGRIANYEADMARARTREAARVAQAPAGPASDAALLALMHEPKALADGKERFASTCSACHRPDGGGMIGPNLTDEYWLHGGRPLEILSTVTHGVPDKGMPEWSATLRPDEIASVVAYVLTLRDTHPPNPKEPQGTHVEGD